MGQLISEDEESLEDYRLHTPKVSPTKSSKLRVKSARRRLARIESLDQFDNMPTSRKDEFQAYAPQILPRKPSARPKKSKLPVEWQS